MTSLRRAAFIAELEDGTRMLYELRAPDLSLDVEHVETWDGRVIATRTEVTITGDLVGGTIWHGDMPTTPPQEVTEPRKELSP